MPFDSLSRSQVSGRQLGYDEKFLGNNAVLKFRQREYTDIGYRNIYKILYNIPE